ncbi:MAG: hypothetical protein NVS3B5_18140 [Sphingomicrobium sp.]
MKVEIIRASGCHNCDAAGESLRMAALGAADGVEWREVNVLEEMDYAVELGVLSLPAIAIDGELIFASLPTAKQLSLAITRRTSVRA